MEHDKSLYEKIASLRINRIVFVSNRKGWETPVIIRNITKLEPRDLQLLVPGKGTDFKKMVALYQYYKDDGAESNQKLKNEALTESESDEIIRYIDIFKSNNFTEHFQVNKYIADNGLWNNFIKIRSLNDHWLSKDVPGIQPKYFKIICRLLKIQGGNGSPLVGCKTY